MSRTMHSEDLAEPEAGAVHEAWPWVRKFVPVYEIKIEAEAGVALSSQ